MNKAERKYLFQEAILLVVLSYFLILEVANRDLTIQPLLVASLIILSVIILAWFIWGQWLSWRTLIPLFLWIVLVVVTLLTSTDPRRSITEMGIMLLIIFLFLLSMDLVVHGWKSELIIKCLLIIGFIIVVFTWYGVLQWYRGWLLSSPGDWIPEIGYRLPSPNVQAWNFNPLLMLIGGRLLFAKSKSSRILLILYGLATFGLIYLSSSRSGWIATGIGLVILLFAYVRLTKLDWKGLLNRLYHKKTLFVIMLLFCLVVLFLGGFLLYRQALHPSHGSLLRSRYEFWEPAFAAFLANPLFGQGLFTFCSALIQAHSTPPFGIYLHAHSIPLTVAAECGMIGLVLLVLFLLWIIRLFRKKLNELDPDSLPLFIGLAAALSAAATHSLFDSFIGKSFGTFLLAIATGAILARPGKTGLKLIRPYWSLLLPALLLGLIFINIPKVKGAQSSVQADWNSARRYFSEAVIRDPDLATSWQLLGISQAFAAEEEKKEDHLDAISSFQNAIALDPYWALNHLNAGALYLADEKLDAAEESLNMAVRLAPENLVTHLNLAIIEERLGKDQRAIEEYLEVLRIAPEYQDSTFWYLSKIRNDALVRWSESQPDPTLMSFEEKLDALERRPDDGQRYLWVAEDYFIQGKYEEAERVLTRSSFAFTLTPINHIDILEMRARIAAIHGQFETAIDLGEEVLLVLTRRGIAGPGTNQGSLYNQLAFRSPSTQEELVPQVRTLGLRISDERFFNEMRQWYELVDDEEGITKLEEILHQIASYELTE